jgi:hypothetical protein
MPAQFWQSAPPVPQAVACVPTAQMSPTQQPDGQLAASQSPVATHCPTALQLSVVPHATQAAPLFPHADVVGATQSSPRQQPSQVSGPHEGAAAQAPPTTLPCPTHASPFAQASQR